MDLKINSAPQNYQTVDASRARQQLLQHFDDHQIIPLNPPSFLFRVDSYSIERLHIYHIEFVGGVEFRNIVNHDDIIIHLLLSNRVEVRTRNSWKRMDAPAIFVLNPDNAPDFRFPEGGRMLVLQINHKTLDQQARQLIQPSPQQPLQLPILGFSSHATHNLQRTFEFMFAQYNSLQNKELRQLWLSQADQFTCSQILLNLDNNFTAQLDYRHQHPLPTTLRMACEHLQARLDEPFNIRELCQHTGASQRSLQYQFKQHFNCSPRAYYQAMRLDALHRDLTAATDQNSVTELAMKWGFNHSGRLAEYYRKRFGELPSQTLAK